LIYQIIQKELIFSNSIIRIICLNLRKLFCNSPIKQIKITANMKAIQFSLIISLVFLLSCRNKIETHPDHLLNDDDKSWNIYHVGDTLKFRSNYNHKRNYRVTEVKQGMGDNPDDNLKYEYILILASRIDTTITGITTGIEMTFARDQNTSQPGLVILCWVDEYLSSSPFNLLKSHIIDTLKINNFIYNNVLKNIGGDSIVNGYANKVYYVEEKGWLRFESNSGEKWDRIN
jgi:hypothetical protein